MWSPYHKGLIINRRKRKDVSKFQDDDQFFSVNDFLLREPNTKKIDNENIFTSSNLEIGHSSMQGYRKTMEDKHIISDFPSSNDHTLVAIMDGHSGSGAAIVTSVRLLHIIEATEYWKDYINRGKSPKDSELISRALVNAFIELDKELKISPETNGSGCTCVCAVITPTHIVTASVGDSRCVISSGGRVINMTEDHKPSNREEAERIIKAGGKVRFDRVNGDLAMSRALGDFQYKDNPRLPDTEQLVICIPDIAIHERSVKDEFLILACDGIWDVMSNIDAVTFLLDVESKFGNNRTINQIPKKNKVEMKSVEATVDRKGKEDEVLSSLDLAEALVDLSLVSGSTDNLSSIVVRFKNH